MVLSAACEETSEAVKSVSTFGCVVLNAFERRAAFSNTGATTILPPTSPRAWNPVDISAFVNKSC